MTLVSDSSVTFIFWVSKPIKNRGLLSVGDKQKECPLTMLGSPVKHHDLRIFRRAQPILRRYTYYIVYMDIYGSYIYFNQPTKYSTLI